MDELSFTGRASLASPETTWRLSDEALDWTSDKDHGRLPFADVAALRLYAMPKTTLPLLGGATLTPGFAQCIIKPKRGKTLRLVSAHYRGLGDFEDRSAAFDPFAGALIRRVADANPEARLVQGAAGGIWALWLGVLILCVLCGLFGALVVVEGVKLGFASHWIEVLGGAAFVAVCAVNARSMWRLVSQTRGRLRLDEPG